MATPPPTLLSRSLAALSAELEADASAPDAWERAQRALADAGDDEPELRAALEARDREALRAIVAGWASGRRLLPVHDREVLKHALKAFRKSLKVTRLDAESKIGRSPTSSGRESGIVGITPPPHYPREIWDELVRQGRLLRDRHGMYELPPDAG
jgi:hypothetical protein